MSGGSTPCHRAPWAISTPIARSAAEVSTSSTPSPTTLFCKHIFWVAEKECSTAERRRQIRASRVDRYHTVAD